MAAAQVLSSPELVSLILQCFKEQTSEEHYFENRLTRSTLAEAARVNHIWFEAVTRVLWSYQQIWGPSMEDLDNIECSRRQIYASRMVSMSISQEPENASSAAFSVGFPRLNNLAVEQVGFQNGLSRTTVQQLLRPSIKSISFFSWFNGFDRDLLTTLNSQCTRLRSVALDRINEGGTDITPEDFNNFFCNKPIESISLDFGPPLMSNRLISTFANMENLKKLSITERIFPEAVPEAFLSEDASFFQSLKEVDIMLDRESVEPITLAFRHAWKVDLNIWSQPEEQMTMFSHLKHMVNLTKLDLEFEGDGTFLETEDLYCFGALTNLERLSIGAREEEYNPIFLEHSGDLSLRKIVPSMPRLQHLEWLLGAKISIDTLKILSTHCSKLSLGNFNGPWEFSALVDEPGCLFPELTNLTLYRENRDRKLLKQIKLAFRRHAPKVKQLILLG